MPGFMFQDVVSPRARSHRKSYTLPLSFLVHTSIVAILVVVPLIATNVPKPRAMLQFVEPFVPVVPEPPPVRRAPVAPAPQGTTGAPVVAPDVIGVETGLIFTPGDVETAGIDNIVGGLVAAEAAADVAPVPPLAPPEPIAAADLLTPPARIKYVMPEYPGIARAARIQGVVVIEAIIGLDGTIERARVLRSNPMLDQAALSAVKAWEYTPTLLNGRPTPVIMTVTVNFRLEP